jgi:hypothetical protein
MGDILSEVQRWRLKADELRATAAGLTNAIARDSLQEMADGYDRLADHMEDLEAKKRARRLAENLAAK